MPADTANRPASPAEVPQPTATAESAPDKQGRSSTSHGEHSDRSQAQLKAYLSEVTSRIGDPISPGPELEPPPGVRVEYSGGGGGGGGGQPTVIDGGQSDSQSAGDSSGSDSAADHDGSDPGGGDGADIQGGFPTYIGAASDSGKGSGAGSPTRAGSPAAPADQDPAADSATAPPQATGASLTFSVAVPESATGAGTDGTDTPNLTSGDGPAQPSHPPDGAAPPTAETPDQDSVDAAGPGQVARQPGAQLVGIIPGPKHGTDGQPGFSSEFTAIYQNPDGGMAYDHGSRGISADGIPYISLGSETSAPTDDSPASEGTDEGAGDGAGPEGATGSDAGATGSEDAAGPPESGEKTPAPGTVTVEAEVRMVNEQTNELETVAEVNETVPPGGHASGDSGKLAASGAHPEGKVVESTSENAEPADPPPGDTEPTGTGADKPEAAAEQPTQGSPADGASAGGSEENFQSFLEGAVYGDYADNDSWSALAGQTAVGFVPGLGQLGDVRDIAHAVGEVAEGKDGAWTDLAINLAAVVPGLDVLKGVGKVGKHADEAVDAVKHLDTVGTGAKHADDAATGAKNADAAGTGTKHADDPTTVSKPVPGTEGPSPGHATADKPVIGKRTTPNGGTVIDRGKPGRRPDDPRGIQQRYHRTPDGRTVRTFEWSDSNLQHMLDGQPPIGNDGNPMVLHHRGQSPHILDEHTATFHRNQSRLLHDQNVSRHDLRPGGRNSADPYPGQRERYWVTRAREYLDRMKSD